MHRSRRRRRPRQLVLTEQDQQVPQWATLPEEIRREIVELLAKLLRAGSAAGEGDDDE